MEVRPLADDRERRRAVEILRGLWTDRDPAAVRAWIDDDEYHAIGRVDGPDLVGVAGVSTTEVLHHEPVAWLVDLVVEESRRGEGHGTALVEYVESWAAERDCEYVALASPRAKTGVHDFYEDRGFERWGYVIEKGVDPVTD